MDDKRTSEYYLGLIHGIVRGAIYGAFIMGVAAFMAGRSSAPKEQIVHIPDGPEIYQGPYKYPQNEETEAMERAATKARKEREAGEKMHSQTPQDVKPSIDDIVQPENPK